MTDREIAERIAHDVAVESGMAHESLSALTAVIQEGIDRALAALGEPDGMETNAEERAQWNSYDPQTQPTGWLTPLARAARDVDRLLAREAKAKAEADKWIAMFKQQQSVFRAREAKAREEERERAAKMLG